MKSISSLLSRIVVSCFTVVYPYVLISTPGYTSSYSDVVAALALFNFFSLIFSFSLNLEFFSPRARGQEDLRVIYIFSFMLLVLSFTILNLLNSEELFYGELLSAFVIAFFLLIADKQRAQGFMGRYLVLIFIGYSAVFGVAIIQLLVYEAYMPVILLRALTVCFVMAYVFFVYRWAHVQGLIRYMAKYKGVISINFIGLLSFWAVSQLDRFLINILDTEIADAYAKTLLSFTSISVVMLSLPTFVGGIIKSEWDRSASNHFYSIVYKKMILFVFLGFAMGGAQAAVLNFFGVLETVFQLDYFLAMLCFLVFCTYLALVRVNMAVMNYESRSQERLIYMFLFIPIPVLSVFLGVFFKSVLVIFITNVLATVLTYHFLASRLVQDVSRGHELTGA